MTHPAALPCAILAVVLLAALSLFVGVTDIAPMDVLRGQADARQMQVLLASRVPRTLALVLAGAATAVAGLVMQMIVRNRFVEPSTTGTVESAGLGLLVVTVLAPGMPVMGKMLIASLFALAGTALFMRILRMVPLRDVLLVPLVGIMLGGVIGAVTTFFAYRFDLLASVGAWSMGDFSGVLRGRYELLWLAGALAVAAYAAADRLTLAAMGRDFTTNLGLNYRSTMVLGLIIVSLVSATVLVTVGVIPFLGLIVPNVVSLMIGDNMRRTVPWVAVMGTGFVLICDILGRTIRAPYEIPIATMLGVIGSAAFLFLLLRRRHHAAP
ncbi:ABC transporter permease [Falsirhodobacter algicola]|uniref:Iron chelate uptake ABC transporter family permease subunit n=1 Tax=Falsirhodobacter algicola TaxID=2692330 RepID=A0A8J8SKE5_9RHOB|nr:ABC transporter permease [Falsirhodobacter algicola]QUS35323.1 iron chelate uptake ABC transporter family permease subunit [Falsirhodobacter algicola]